MDNKIIGIGIDSIEIERFSHWHTYPQKSLRRIFSQQEIDYCLSCPAKSAERFAARFATREAFLKAFHQAFPDLKVPLLTVCAQIAITHSKNGVPQLQVNQHLLPQSFQCLVSWTHTQTIATSIVIISH